MDGGDPAFSRNVAPFNQIRFYTDNLSNHSLENHGSLINIHRSNIGTRKNSRVNTPIGPNLANNTTSASAHMTPFSNRKSQAFAGYTSQPQYNGSMNTSSINSFHNVSTGALATPVYMAYDNRG